MIKTKFWIAINALLFLNCALCVIAFTMMGNYFAVVPWTLLGAEALYDFLTAIN
jgi:hypothetical protein